MIDHIKLRYDLIHSGRVVHKTNSDFMQYAGHILQLEDMDIEVLAQLQLGVTSYDYRAYSKVGNVL